jgi:hypothetical protein
MTAVHARKEGRDGFLAGGGAAGDPDQGRLVKRVPGVAGIAIRWRS